MTLYLLPSDTNVPAGDWWPTTTTTVTRSLTCGIGALVVGQSTQSIEAHTVSVFSRILATDWDSSFARGASYQSIDCLYGTKVPSAKRKPIRLMTDITEWRERRVKR